MSVFAFSLLLLQLFLNESYPSLKALETAAGALGLSTKTDGLNRLKLAIANEQSESREWLVDFERVKPGEKAFW